ncbi:MAG: hypothetical protein HUJ68_12175, partial [Clostridia bacterium]|nr:hypothetical protein [Clostridia bacterium]
SVTRYKNILTTETKQLKGILDKYDLINTKTTEVNEGLKSIGLDLGRTWKDIKSGFGIFDPLKKILDLKSYVDKALSNDEVFQKMTMNYSLSAKEGNVLKHAMQGTLVSLDSMGIKAEELAQLQTSYTDELGRTQILTKEEAVSMSAVSKSLNMGTNETAKLASQMNLFGLSITTSSQLLNNMVVSSKEMGVSMEATKKVFMTIAQLGITNIFKDGVDGMARMASYAAKMKIDMGQIASFAEKVSSPEGAIETAASLQGLGGAYSSLADPLSMLNEGLNDMEGLMHRSQAMIRDSFIFNEKNGQVEFSGGAMDKLRLQQYAKSTGQNFEKLAEQARNSALMDEAKKHTNKSLTDEQRDYIASKSKYVKGKGFVTSVYDEKTNTFVDKSISQLSIEDMRKIMPDKVDIKDIALNMQGMKSTLENIATHVQNMAGSFIFKGFDFFKNGIKNTSNSIAGTNYDTVEGNSISSLISSGNAVHKLGVLGTHLTTKYAPKILEKTGKKAAASALTKMGEKTLLKRLPIIGTILSGIDAINRFAEGDYSGAGLQTLSAIASIFPGLGTAISIGLDAATVAKDFSNYSNNASFDGGGYTGDGGKYEIAGLVHKGETVFNQTMTKSPIYGPIINDLNRVQIQGISPSRVGDFNANANNNL